jgi:predicted NUDIX family phosphoesterase
MKTEKILVLPAATVNTDSFENSILPTDVTAIQALMVTHEFHPRYMMEEDPSFLQIIPYVVIQNAAKEILVYRRSAKGGEDRLHDKFSIGVGGHLDFENESLSGFETYINGMAREIKEEVNLDIDPHAFVPKFLIFDPSNDVGKVHLGVVTFIEADLDIGHGELDVLVDREFLSLEEIIESRYDSLENWSKIVVDEMKIGG